mmetsp:Transcript_25097/g.50006  ORF Transcript_25097/g.50006 Transcript_25097/m.50006 type:complete len:204 (+) Transcript_25097:75-686(+)
MFSLHHHSRPPPYIFPPLAAASNSSPDMGRRGFFFRLYVYPTNWLSSTPISTRLGLAPLGLMAGAASGKWSKLRVISSTRCVKRASLFGQCLRYSSISSMCSQPVGINGPGRSWIPSQSNPANQGCLTICSNCEARLSGPARRHAMKLRHCGLTLFLTCPSDETVSRARECPQRFASTLTSSGMCRHCCHFRIFLHVVTGSSA